MFHGMSIGSLLVILLIAVLVFGSKRLRNIGSDLGAAIKSIQAGLQSSPSDEKDKENKNNPQ